MSDYLNCKQCMDFLADYIAGETGEEATARFESHLELCPPCRDYIETYRQTIEMGRASLEVPEDQCSQMPESLVRAICAARKVES